jgi:hypothetical protein
MDWNEMNLLLFLSDESTNAAEKYIVGLTTRL